MSRPGIKKPLEEKLEKPCAAAMRRLNVPWFRWGIILFSLALAGASIYYTLGHLTVNTSRKDLISGNQRLIERSNLIDREFGGRDGLVVVVENATPGKPPGLPRPWPPNCAAIRTASPSSSIGSIPRS